MMARSSLVQSSVITPPSDTAACLKKVFPEFCWQFGTSLFLNTFIKSKGSVERDCAIFFEGKMWSQRYREPLYRIQRAWRNIYAEWRKCCLGYVVQLSVIDAQILNGHFSLSVLSKRTIVAWKVIKTRRDSSLDQMAYFFRKRRHMRLGDR